MCTDNRLPAVSKTSFADAGTGRGEPSGAPQQQAGSADDEEWQATQPHLLPLKAKIVGLRAHLADMQTQLVAAQQERDRPDRPPLASGAATSLLAQADAAEAFWRLKQQEAADAEAEWRSLRLEADGVSKVQRLQYAVDKAEGELEAASKDVLKFF